MPDPRPEEAQAARRGIRWDALAAIIASLVGLLALLVAGYTAYVQRQQVRAQVWPYVISGNNDLTQALVVDNKGVGPAIVRSVQLRVDGRPQADWDHALAALGLTPRHFIQTSINHEVLTPGEDLQVIRFPDKGLWQRFHDAATDRIAMDICFCSTLGECWVSGNKNLIGPQSMALQITVKQVEECRRLPPSEVFNN